MRDMVELITDLVQAEGLQIQDIKGVGVGVPGTVNPERGELIYACNLPQCRNMPLREEMKNALHLPLFLDKRRQCGRIGRECIRSRRRADQMQCDDYPGNRCWRRRHHQWPYFCRAYHGGTELGHLVIRGGRTLWLRTQRMLGDI